MRTSTCSFLFLVFVSVPLLAPAQSDLGRDADGKMIAYQQPISGSDVSIDMVPIPAGELQVGDATIKIPPLWIGKYEVTCEQYGEFMRMHRAFVWLREKGVKRYAAGKTTDTVSAPTELYDPELQFGCSPRDDSPATAMTQFAARQFTKWLSLLTETEYRLPHEAEWKYACLSGNESLDETQLKQQVVFGHPELKRRRSFQDCVLRVGTRQPSAWGLHDMLGNVAELVINDEVIASKAPIPEKYRIHRAYGGHFASNASHCKFDSYMMIDEDWWDNDPGFPRSPTWMATETRIVTVGFRIVRPASPMSDHEKQIAWEADSEQLAKAIIEFADLDWQKRGRVDSGLPAAIREHVPSSEHRVWRRK